MEYKRLTKKGGLDFADKNLSLADEWGYSHIYNRLAELEDKIEQGTLIELPCKVGDTVYETEGVRIYEHKIDRIIYVDKMLIYDTNEIMFDERAIGKSIFLTREEAEKRAKELQG